MSLIDAANLALALAKTSPLGRAPRVGLLDLDIFGPSVPMLMGLDHAGEPAMNERKWYSLELWATQYMAN